jgi:hypothetical protein
MDIPNSTPSIFYIRRTNTVGTAPHVIVRDLKSRREKKVSAGWQSGENGRKKNGGRHNGGRRKEGSRTSCEQSNGHVENRRSHRVSTSESGNSCNVNERSNDESE